MPNADAARRRKVKNATSDRLWWASRTGNEREVEKILPRVASTEWKDPKNGWTALHAAVCNDTDPQDRTTAMLLRGGANPNVTDENGVTPLQCACLYNKEVAVHQLVRNGADLNVATKLHGWTPLHFAARDDNAYIVRTLVQNDFIKVNPLTTKEYWGVPAKSTPLDVALAGKQDREIIELLKAHGAQEGNHEDKRKAMRDFGRMKIPPIWRTL